MTKIPNIWIFSEWLWKSASRSLYRWIAYWQAKNFSIHFNTLFHVFILLPFASTIFFQYRTSQWQSKFVDCYKFISSMMHIQYSPRMSIVYNLIFVCFIDYMWNAYILSMIATSLAMTNNFHNTVKYSMKCQNNSLNISCCMVRVSLAQLFFGLCRKCSCNHLILIKRERERQRKRKRSRRVVVVRAASHLNGLSIAKYFKCSNRSQIAWQIRHFPLSTFKIRYNDCS